MMTHPQFLFHALSCWMRIEWVQQVRWYVISPCCTLTSEMRVFKVYLFTQKYFWYMKETHVSSTFHQHSEKKGQISNEIIHFKVPKNITLTSGSEKKDCRKVVVLWFLNLLVGSLIQNNRSGVVFFFQTHWFHYIFETLRCIISLLMEPFLISEDNLWGVKIQLYDHNSLWLRY